MKASYIFGLIGGLALFLYGMHMMSGIEEIAGSRLKCLLERLTSNRFAGVLVGAGVTAVVQSSSATTVMVVGFVNAQLLTLRRATWVIMGANIGTTITGQLIALDIGLIAPVLAIIGVAMCVFVKNSKINGIGSVIAGLGILFIGMNHMSSSMAPLAESPSFTALLTKFDNPLLGIAVGAAFTAIIQSSSASVGVLEALALSSVISPPAAVYLLFGQNIGTCITAIISALGMSRSAKRATLIHLIFNITGTVIFSLVAYFTDFAQWVCSWTPDNPAMQIANLHTVFNVGTTAMLLPIGALLPKLAYKILPKRPIERSDVMSLMYIGGLASSSDVGRHAIALGEAKQELIRMAQMVKVNLNTAFDALLGKDEALPDAERTERYIDYLNKEISDFLSKRLMGSSRAAAAYFTVSGNLERIADHALNIIQYAEIYKKSEANAIRLSEIKVMKDMTDEFFSEISGMNQLTENKLFEAENTEQRFDEVTDRFRKNELERLKNGKTDSESGIIYDELLTDFERIGDHLLNIAQALSNPT